MYWFSLWSERPLRCIASSRRVLLQVKLLGRYFPLRIRGSLLMRIRDFDLVISAGLCLMQVT
ncbi:hypothetical protein GW16_18275 [Xanthomonas arboricola pv. celebensis]|nr:hypothetical protein GW16_18275 [Xanthomonas arboricola pv. celebensis]